MPTTTAGSTGSTRQSPFFKPVVQRQPVIQRMAACPTHLNDSDPVPTGWRLYPGPTAVFHCGFRTILEQRAPTPSDPMNECVYDHSGVLVDVNHPYAGCRGTPDQYDASAGIGDALRHTFTDSGGIVAEGGPAFVTSRVYEVSTAIASGISVASASLGAIGRIAGTVILQGIMTGRAICDPGNWTYNILPVRSRRHLNFMGAIISSLSLSGSPDNLLINLSKHLSDYPVAGVLTEIAADINTAMSSRGNPVRFTVADIGRLSMYQLMLSLEANGLVSFNRPPAEMGSEEAQRLLQGQP
ncbi:hypothetical protein MMC2321_00894 [Chitinophaga sp. MM2321]